MALVKTTIIGPASGSIGGVTLSRNRGGAYIRQRAIPVNPNTSFQQEVRSAMSQLSSRWSGVLTQALRDAWDSYALNVPLTNPLGDPVNVGGLGMYQRCNVPLLQTGQAGGVIIDVAPTIFNLGEYTAPAVVDANTGAQTVSIDIDNTDAWANEDDSDMLVFISRPKNPSINYFKGPYRFAGAVEGDAITPPITQQDLDSPFTFVEGQKIFVRVAVLRVDGRYSADFRGSVISTA